VVTCSSSLAIIICYYGNPYVKYVNPSTFRKSGAKHSIHPLLEKVEQNIPSTFRNPLLEKVE
jgi:hypothetical protein